MHPNTTPEPDIDLATPPTADKPVEAIPPLPDPAPVPVADPSGGIPVEQPVVVDPEPVIGIDPVEQPVVN